MKHRNSPKVTINEWKGLIKSYLVRFFMLILFWIPLKQNHIMINNHARKGVSCNPKYLAIALQKQYGNTIKIFWVSEYPESCHELNNIGISVIRANSWEHIRNFFTSKIYITNDSFPHWARHRRKQLWINTWHGAINYKHIGYDYLPAMNFVGRKLFLLKNRKPNIFVAGSRFFAENTAESFRLPANIFLLCGLPRNDLFFEDNQIMRQQILDRLNLTNTQKIVLYAPTFRNDGRSSVHGMDFKRLQTVLQRRFGGNWVILFRNHNFITEKRTETSNIQDVSTYPDMQELLLVTDILISDYSSCMWDFSLLKRPCFVYAPDLDDYQNYDRNFAYPLEKWPYPIARTNEDLMNCILHFEEKDFLAKLEKHHKDAGRLDHGMATQKLLERMNLDENKWRKQ